MKASEAAKITFDSQLDASLLLDPFLKEVYKQIEQAAKNGRYDAKVNLPIKHGTRTPTQFSEPIKHSLKIALENEGYTVEEFAGNVQVGGYSPGSSSVLYWHIWWSPNGSKSQ